MAVRLLLALMLISGGNVTAEALDALARERSRMLEEIALLTRETRLESGRAALAERVMAALAKVPRHEFVPPDQKRHAYQNRPLPIGLGQTISQPFIVALMTDIMDIKPGDKVLEIGTGSGYQAAVLAELAGTVYTIEIVEPLAREAAERLKSLGYHNVVTRIGDGYKGWAEHAPFDAIMVTAAPREVPLVVVAAQSPTGTATKAATPQTAAAAKAPRTPWGQPDLQGIWTYKTTTPLERPAKYKGREFLTNEELAQAEQAAAALRFRDTRAHQPGAVTDVGRAYDVHWFDRTGKPNRRTSLIVDPPDGRMPPIKPEAEKKFQAWAASKGLFASAASIGGRPEDVEDGTEGGIDGRGSRADNPEDRRLSERCITFGVPRLPGGYNANIRIAQDPDYVVIEMEMAHEARVVPLDGRPHLPQSVRQWLGDARGRWEGDTLVVDTTNFTDKNPFRGSMGNLHMIERFTRIDAATIDYKVTFEDPTTWARPWPVQMPFVSLQSLHDAQQDDVDTVPQIFEYACHEGNYGLPGQLRGARAVEAAEGAKKGSR